MRLSTSNSRLPRIDAPRAWLRTLACFLVLLLALEWSLRSQGISPSQSDTTLLWVATRDRLTPEDVVLAGASRNQQGLDRARIEQRLEKTTLQLSVNDSVPWSLVDHLAHETGFRGLLILSATPHGLREGYKLDRRDQFEQINAWKQKAWSSPIENRLRLLANGNLATRRGGVDQRLLAPLGILSDTPMPIRLVDAHRQVFADFSQPEAAQALMRRWAAETRALGPDQVPAAGLFVAVRDAVATIRSRGGRVLLLRMPSSGALRAAEARTLPRERFWDPFVAEVGGRSIHFEDYPSLARFRCPDGSHLDRKDARGFTDALLAVMAREG